MIRSHIQSQQSAATADVVTPEVVVVADVHGASVIKQRKNFTSQLSSTIAFQCFTYSLSRRYLYQQYVNEYPLKLWQ